MKLAFYLFNYFPFGGLERDFLEISKACLAKGYSIDVFTMKWEGERLPGLNITLVPVEMKLLMEGANASKFPETVIVPALKVPVG